MARPVGIDLGTTNSVVVVFDGGEPTVIVNAEGSRTTPSVVAFAKKGGVLVGEAAKRQAVTNVDQTIRSVKRQMGTDWMVTIDRKEFTAQQISAFVLQKLKRDAEAYLGEVITDAVITVPAYFSDAQRQATMEAGQIAGFNVLRIINEPTAAALAYHLEKQNDAIILVFDLGGGTFDVSLLQVDGEAVEVKATSGDNHLGGDDWDQRVVDWLVQDFKNGYGIDLSKDKMALQRLREAAEKAKIELSGSVETQINLPYVTQSEQGPLHLDAELTRAEFQRMTSDLLDRCKSPFQQVIKDAEVKMDDLHHVVLVGGSTRMPAVVNLVKQLTGGKEPNKGVNPDEVVAVGACLQASVLKGEVKDILLLDVTPLSLGIQTKGGIFTKLIERNTIIPTKRSEIFTTAVDNQASVQIQVFQGEREIAAYNKKLGMFELAGIAPSPRGVPQIEVTFDIDANGIVNVSAKELGTGKQQSVQITGGSALPKEDLDRMVAEAKQYAEVDRKRREEGEVRNHADSLAYQSEKFLSENEDKIPQDIKSEVREALAEMKRALESKDTDTVRSAAERITQVSQKMGTAIYQQDLQSNEVDQDIQVLAEDEVVEDGILDEAHGQPVRTASANTSYENRSRNVAADASALSAFVSYSHKDERYRRTLDTSLTQLKRNGIISVWHDRKILPGQQWDKEIDRSLETANIVLVLVSPDFLASEYAYTREMQIAIERHHAGRTTVIPVILRPSDWLSSPLGSLQALPSDGRPISMWNKRDQAWLDVVYGLRQLVSNRILGYRTTRSSP